MFNEDLVTHSLEDFDLSDLSHGLYYCQVQDLLKEGRPYHHVLCSFKNRCFFFWDSNNNCELERLGHRWFIDSFRLITKYP